MAKQPKKPSAPVKPAAKTPKMPAPAPKVAKKPATTSAKPKPVKKAAAPTAKPTPVKTAAKAAAAKPAAKTKSKATVKAAPKKAAPKTAAPKTAAPKKAAPKKAAAAPPPVAAVLGVHPEGGGAPAAPQITSPLAGAAIPAGADLTVYVSTNRPDLGYIIQLTDVTPPPAPPPVPAVPFQLPVPAPTGNPFSGTIPGANIAPGRVYQIRVFVNPNDGGTPPNQDHTITVNS